VTEQRALRLPEGFRFGVATAGAQVEGGYNGSGEPANNWAAWEAEGRVEPAGDALRFWDRYEEQLDRAVDAGCDAFRLSVEWARGEPAPGEVDGDALDRYAAIVEACTERGLEPLVTLHHFTTPAWLGPDPWLAPDSPERFADWSRRVVGHLGPRCRRWVTVNELNVYALSSYLSGAFPPGRRGAVAPFVRSLDHLLAAHVLAYDTIKAGTPDATVATNNFCFSIYELDRLLTDVLLARRNGVGRADLGHWLDGRRRAFHGSVGQVGWREVALRRVTAAILPLERALPRAVAAIYASPHESTLDVTQVDFYNPLVSSHLRIPLHATAGGRSPEPIRHLWDDPPDPAAHARYLRLGHEPGLPLWVVENGLCNRVRRGRSFPRADGWDRPRYLRANVGAVVAALDGGVPVAGYYHWTLADNWEWGSYNPRFGLHGVDRTRGGRWSDTDAMGDDAAGAYRRIADGLRSGDRSVVDVPAP
jgi:beta-glucosidase